MTRVVAAWRTAGRLTAARVTAASVGVPVAAALALALAGCGGGEGGAGVGWAGSVDTVDGVVVVSNPTTPIWSREEAWTLEEDLTIGVAEGDPNYTFAGIRDLEVDGSGRIYVLDGRARHVAVYDVDGTFVRTLGRQGEGPGEFKGPSDLFWESDTLVVFDRQLFRFNYFSGDGTLIGDDRADLSFFPSQFRSLPSGRLVTQSGPGFSMPMRPGVDGIGVILSIAPGSWEADTLLRWQTDRFKAVRSETRMTVVSRYYGPRTVWSAGSDGRIYVARGGPYEIEVYGPDGHRSGTIRRIFRPPPVTTADRDSALAAIERRAESSGAMGGLIRDNTEIAEVKPAILGLLAADDGYLWVLVSRENGWTEQTWDVLDPRGRYLGSVDLPARLSVKVVRDDALYGIWRDELDVEYVKRYAIRRPGPQLDASGNPSSPGAGT